MTFPHSGALVSTVDSNIIVLKLTDGASANPITMPLDKDTHLFSYTRRAGSGLTYTAWVSTDLQDWGAEPVVVTEESGEPDENDVETVLVELNNPPVSDQLFIRVKAE